MFTTIDELTNQLLGGLDTVSDTYTANCTKIKELEAYTEDLMHEAEFANFDLMRGYTFSTKLQVIRQERRRLKDQNELLWSAHNFLLQNPAFKSGLTKALTAGKRREKELSDRVYVPRTELGARIEQGQVVYEGKKEGVH